MVTDPLGWTLFATALGPCAIAWDGVELAGVSLPERDEAATRARAARRWGRSRERPAPAPVRPVIEAVVTYLDGGPAELGSIALPLERVPAFAREVYRITREIPRGHTLTYGDIARRLGDVRLARAVGHALGQNPWPLLVPCHRVIAAEGGSGGFSGGEGRSTKLRLLELEGAVRGGEPSLFD